ncbi:hypothetical protein [Pedobacter soli]|uniref:Leucine Rich repeat-containing protein n=1 Tax=Pedobacter soli TaxID=390242 RepID=A0A1G6XYM4_9SPHI|nr:hypothetical protein [Pedobacter soli]SDD82495.1 hypothetical protein SAMN04488024_10869 [Pedobacter soli]
MDWRFNTIWFEQLDQNNIFRKDFKTPNKRIDSNDLANTAYAIVWHLKEKLNSFESLPESERLLYLELNWANIKDFVGIEKFKNLRRLELHYCTKLTSYTGLNLLKDSLEFLHINQSKKLVISEELLSLSKIKVLRLNACGDIDNLDFLSNFPELIDFRFLNTNILDGNLQPILNHPTIRSVGFLNKRHYNYKAEKIDSLLKEKFPEDHRIYVYNEKGKTFRY